MSVAISAAVINVGKFVGLQRGKLLPTSQSIPSQPVSSWEGTGGAWGTVIPPELVWTSDKGWSWAVMDQRPHRERNSVLASC